MIYQALISLTNLNGNKIEVDAEKLTNISTVVGGYTMIKETDKPDIFVKESVEKIKKLAEDEMTILRANLLLLERGLGPLGSQPPSETRTMGGIEIPYVGLIPPPGYVAPPRCECHHSDEDDAWDIGQ